MTETNIPKQTMLERYIEIEKKLLPVVDYLEDRKEKDGIKGLYKGIITLQSPIIPEPEILFIGINPGEGAYNALNKGRSERNGTPLRMVVCETSEPKLLNLYQIGNARFKEKGNDWVGYNWFERDKPKGNRFPRLLIDLLYEVAKCKYPHQYKENTPCHTAEPFWFDDFGKKIMYTNLYPIATKNTKDLDRIFSRLGKSATLLDLWEKKRIWEVKRFFIKQTNELVKLTQPKVIVCVGSTAYKDFTYQQIKKSERIFCTTKYDIPVIGFSRSGSWSNLTPHIAKKINEML